MNRFFINLCRTLHIYLTLLGLLVMLFFSVTGIILNHDEWFMGQSPKVVEKNTAIDPALIQKNDKLAIVESLRSSEGVRGALASFDELPDVLALRFESPGQIFNIEISKSDGKTHIYNEIHSLWAIMSNLHRGHGVGPVWKWVLDITAGLVALACVTGLILWITLPKRRKLGIIALIIGIAGTIVVYLIFVPGGDFLLK
jgi:uncharacterized protein